jgi:hypothetical protein
MKDKQDDKTVPFGNCGFPRSSFPNAWEVMVRTQINVDPQDAHSFARIALFRQGFWGRGSKAYR